MTLVERARAAAASYWTAGAAWAVMSALHWRWLWRSAHAGDVLSAYGAGLVVLGVWVAARPYLRNGLEPWIAAVLPQDQATYAVGNSYSSDLAEAQSRARPGVTRDVWAERVVAVGVVVVGTLLNGWGTPLARRWHLPV